MAAIEAYVSEDYPGRIRPAESAPSSADFLFHNQPKLQVVGESFVPFPPPLLETILAQEKAGDLTAQVDTVLELNEYFKGLLSNEHDKHYRNANAAYYADFYREQLDIDDRNLSYEQYSALIASRLYLSALSSLGHLGLFIETGKALGGKSPEFEDAKLDYLAARKVYQDDVDAFLDHFCEEADDKTLIAVLMDISNMTRLTMKEREFIDAKMDDDSHVFVGSVLSERLVKISMQEFIDPGVRYGDEDEDRSPTRADVVWPRDDGDVYVQVKMRWTKPINLKVQPKKKPPHVIVPLQSLRGDLTLQEHEKVTQIITDFAERRWFEKRREEACALGGIRKHLEMMRISADEFRAWWADTRKIISEEKESIHDALQTGVA